MRRAARIFLAALFFAGFGLGSLLYPCGGFLFGRRFLRFGYRAFVWCGERVGLLRVILSPGDRARLAACRGCVVVMNHLTLIDVIVLSAFLGDSTCLAKGAVSRNPFFAALARGGLLDASDPVRALRRAEELLGAGVNVVVFPQGTRTPVGVARPLHRGAAQIALRAGVPILPVRLACEPPVLAKGKPWWNVGNRTVVFTLRVGKQIPAPKDGNAHTEAVRLTEAIGRAILP